MPSHERGKRSLIAIASKTSQQRGIARIAAIE
jgi:hypothetical protein